MSQENVDIVRRMHGTVGTPASLDFFHPEVVVTNRPSSPDTAPYVGHAGLFDWVRDIREAVGDFRTVAEELIDVDDSRVLAVAGVHGEGRISGLAFDMVTATVFTLTDGLIVRVQAYDTKAEALEAVGLTE